MLDRCWQAAQDARSSFTGATFRRSGNHGFTAGQWLWLSAQFSAAQPNTGFDKATIKWMIGLTALGLAAVAFLWSETGSVRAEIRENRAEIGSVRDQVQANAAALARIEAILNEHLSRPEWGGFPTDRADCQISRRGRATARRLSTTTQTTTLR